PAVGQPQLPGGGRPGPGVGYPRGVGLRGDGEQAGEGEGQHRWQDDPARHWSVRPRYPPLGYDHALAPRTLCVRRTCPPDGAWLSGTYVFTVRMRVMSIADGSRLPTLRVEIRREQGGRPSCGAAHRRGAGERFRTRGGTPPGVGAARVGFAHGPGTQA